MPAGLASMKALKENHGRRTNQNGAGSDAPASRPDGGGSSGPREGGGGGGGPRGPRPGGRPGGGPGGPREGGRKFFRRKKVCKFCVEKIDGINYKDVRLLSGFVAESGKIVPRRLTGVCTPHQRRLTDGHQAGSEHRVAAFRRTVRQLSVASCQFGIAQALLAGMQL